MNLLDFITSNARWLAAGILLTFASCFGQTFFISIFANQIMDSYNISNGEWGRIYGIGTFSSGILMLWAGGLADRFQIRQLAPIMLLILAGFALLMAINPYVILLPFIIFGLRFAGQGMLFHIAMVAMSRWFTATRGRAISISILGFSLGEAFLPFLIVAILASITWGNIWVLTAVLALLLIPIILRLLASERTPQTEAENTESVGMNSKHWTRKDALAHPLFWAIAPSVLMPSIFTTALYFQQVHLSADKGWRHIEFVALFPVYTGVAVLSMLAFGWAVDRFSAIKLLPYYQIPMALGFYVMSIASTLPTAMLAMALIALMQGANASIGIAFWSEVYGTKHVGAIKALGTGFMVFGSAIGPAVTGYFIDRGISFADQMPYITVMVIGVSLLTFISLRAFGPARN